MAEDSRSGPLTGMERCVSCGRSIPPAVACCPYCGVRYTPPASTSGAPQQQPLPHEPEPLIERTVPASGATTKESARKAPTVTEASCRKPCLDRSTLTSSHSPTNGEYESPRIGSSPSPEIRLEVQRNHIYKVGHLGNLELRLEPSSKEPIRHIRIEVCSPLLMETPYSEDLSRKLSLNTFGSIHIPIQIQPKHPGEAIISFQITCCLDSKTFLYRGNANLFILEAHLSPQQIVANLHTPIGGDSMGSIIKPVIQIEGKSPSWLNDAESLALIDRMQASPNWQMIRLFIDNIVISGPGGIPALNQANTLIRKDHQGRVHVLRIHPLPETIWLGRNRDCHIVTRIYPVKTEAEERNRNRRISRVHACISRNRSGFFIQDGNPTNRAPSCSGISIAGQPVAQNQPFKLVPRQEVHLGPNLALLIETQFQQGEPPALLVRQLPRPPFELEHRQYLSGKGVTEFHDVFFDQTWNEPLPWFSRSLGYRKTQPLPLTVSIHSTGAIRIESTGPDPILVRKADADPNSPIPVRAVFLEIGNHYSIGPFEFTAACSDLKPPFYSISE